MEIRTSQSHPIRVNFINSHEFPILNRLGLTFAPGKQQADSATGFWKRDLAIDLAALKNYVGVDTLVSLLEDYELGRLGIPNLASACSAAGIDLIRFPVADYSVPKAEEEASFVLLVERIIRDLKIGRTVVIHCKGGLGRAGTVAACCIIAASDGQLDDRMSVEMVRNARGPQAVENQIQEEFASGFSAVWGARSSIEIPDPKTANETAVSLTIIPEQRAHVDGPDGNDYLLFWQERSVLDHASNGLPLDVVASNKLAGVVPGDAIWLVTLTDDRELMLVGRLIVGEVIEYEEAVRRMPDADLWQAEYYALPAENTAEVLQPVSLSQNLTKLRFGDPDADRFYPVDGRLNPQQLQDLRTLTPESGDLLADLWLNREIYRDPVQNLEERRAEVQNNPNDPEAHYKLALTYCDLEMIDEAVESYQKAIELDPRWLPAHFNLGIISLNRDHLNEAEEHFQAVIDLDPQAADAYFTLGVVYGRGGKPEDSIYVSKLGLQIEPESPLGHFNIGGGYFLLENFSEALKWTKKACDLGYDPEYTTYLIGKCYRHLDRPDDERAAYAHALELAGDFIDGHFALGTVWARVHGGEAGSTVPYVEVGNEIDLENPAQMYMFLLGCLAQGQLGTARELAAQLWQSDELLGSRADHFIDLAAQQEWPEEVRRDTDEDRIEPIDEKEVTESEQPAVTKPERRTRTEIRLMVDGEEVSAKNLPDLYLETLKMLVDKQILDSLELPIASGRKRNIISREPLHKDSSRFFAPVEYGGFFMEAHNSRENGIRQLQQFLANLGIQSSLVTEIGSSVSIPAPVDSRDRFLGSMLGLAVCDALGTTGEFKPTGSFPEINSIVGGGPFNLLPGEWTDDTSMALCLAESLIDCHGFDAKNQMERYLRWYKDGHLSSNGRAFDIGITIRAALDKFDRQVGAKNPFCGSVSPSAAGNGSLMRLAPVALYFAGDPTRSIEWAAESSKTTHGAKECIDACRYFAGLISGALQGRSKEEILSASFSPIDGIWQSDPLADRIAEVANGAFKSKKRPKISSTGQGYVALSLHAALWAFYNTASFKDGAIKVVNLGYDADTYGAIYGQLAGAFYGVNSIPTEWLGVLAQRETIERFAQELFEASGQSNTF